MTPIIGRFYKVKQCSVIGCSYPPDGQPLYCEIIDKAPRRGRYWVRLIRLRIKPKKSVRWVVSDGVTTLHTNELDHLIYFRNGLHKTLTNQLAKWKEQRNV
jgi:hypothetical protein